MKSALIVLMVSCLSGCAYFHDRGRDACDMVTIAGEAPNVGVSLQLGNSAVGIGMGGGKGIGLRSGALGMYETAEFHLGLFGAKILEPDKTDFFRGKGYEYSYEWTWISKEDEYDQFYREHHKHKDALNTNGTVEEGEWFNAWQCEAALGLGVGARAGVNLAEILDFVLGWTTLDICDDDLASYDKKVQEKARRSDKQALKVIDPNAPRLQH
jgi:hypothetical protein